MMVGFAESTDVELIRQAKRGERKAFGELVRRYQKRVYALCFRLGGSHDAADDLTQEAFIKAFQAIESFDEAYPFAAWILRIASNNALNYIKRQKFQVSGEEGELVLEQQAAPKADSDPLEALSREEMDRRYQEAVNQLPPEFKVVFVMRMHEDLSYEEIAARLRISVGTVMSRLHRARQRLVEQLKDLLEP
jgi:RNA polymerase sigma-70 factor (ECF subfamily)